METEVKQRNKRVVRCGGAGVGRWPIARLVTSFKATDRLDLLR